MTYYKDLSPYVYSKSEKSQLPVINIGWLSNGEFFVIGETSLEFREKLHRFCLDENIVLTMRGFQNCEFCGLSWEEWGEKHPSYGENAKLMGVGNGEIRIIGKSKLYAAPALIYHYIVEHGYKPPLEFIEAVLTGHQSDSAEHKALLANYK